MNVLLLEGEEVDEGAIFGALCQIGPDCLRDTLPTFGQRIKVYRVIKAASDTAPCQEVR